MCKKSPNMFCTTILVLLILNVFSASTDDSVVPEGGMTETKNPELIRDVAESMKYILQEYTEKLNILRNELHSVRTENSEMKSVITELQKNMRYLNQRDADQKSCLERNSREINMLKTRFEDMAFTHSQLISSAEVIQNGSSIKTDHLKSRDFQDRFILANTDDTVNAGDATPKKLVGSDFYAKLGQKLAGSEFYARLGQKFEVLVHEQTIIYDITVTNGGLTYNNKTGIFTCTTSGVYVFSWSTLVTADHYVETILRSNKSDLGLTYSGGKGYPGSGSQTVVVNLHQGDNVQVKVGSFTPGSTLYDIYTTFSGFRLQ